MSALGVADREALELHEAIASAPGPIRPDGLVPLHIIRPGIGRGKGRHLYEADMLQNEVGRGRFQGWKMYLDHLDPVAKKKAGGMPRSIRDLAGVIKEAWWDGAVPPDPARGHGLGAVIGLAKVNRFMRALVEDLPEAIGASISATATGVRPVTRDGQQCWLVEGINERGSVDWVTEAGAGGRVVSLMEALEESLDDDEEVRALLEGRSDEEIVELLREEGLLDRPGLRAALLEVDGDEYAEFESYVPGRQLDITEHEGGDEVNAVEVLQEALSEEEGQALLESAAEPIVDRLFRQLVVPRLGELIEAALEDERELMQAEADAVASRRLQLRDLRDVAHRQIDEAKLPEPFKVELRERYSLVENSPTAALDVVDDDPAEAAEPKSAEDKVRERVEADIKVKEEQYRASRPTAVRGQGPSPERTAPKDPRPADEGGEGEKVEESSTGSPRTDYVLREAQVEIDDDLYAGILRS